jgi:hypothetical protein
MTKNTLKFNNNKNLADHVLLTGSKNSNVKSRVSNSPPEDNKPNNVNTVSNEGCMKSKLQVNATKVSTNNSNSSNVEHFRQFRSLLNKLSESNFGLLSGEMLELLQKIKIDPKEQAQLDLSQMLIETVFNVVC